MKVYVVTHGFSDPRYTNSKGVYCGVFADETQAREFVSVKFEEDKKWFDTVFDREFVSETKVIYFEGTQRCQNRYINYAIREEVI